MATSIPLTLNEANDENVNVVITTNQPSAGTPPALRELTAELRPLLNELKQSS